jgi:hypothetical protein
MRRNRKEPENPLPNAQWADAFDRPFAPPLGLFVVAAITPKAVLHLANRVATTRLILINEQQLFA